MTEVKWEIAAKEVREIFSSRKFLGVLGLFLALNLFSVWLGRNISRSVASPGGGETFLIEVFRPLVNLNLPLAAGALGLILSYNSITRERESGTLELLLSYPVYRDEVINGKFIANIFVVALALLFSLTISTGFAMQLTGIDPVVSDFVRLGLVFVGTMIYTGMFTAIGTMFSSFFSSSWRALAAGGILLTLFLATPLLSGIVADQLYPPDPGASDSEEMERKREAFTASVNKFSPTQSYMNYVQKIVGSTYGGYDLKPSTREAFNSASGYLIYLVSETMMAFTLAYGFFMRQDL